MDQQRRCPKGCICIDLVKDGWRATDHRETHLLQMICWLGLRERMGSFGLYRGWGDGEEEVGDGWRGEEETEEVTVGKRTKTRRAWQSPRPCRGQRRLQAHQAATHLMWSLLCYSVACGMQRWPTYEAVDCKASGWTPETSGGLQHSTPNTLYLAHSLYHTVPPWSERYV